MLSSICAFRYNRFAVTRFHPPLECVNANPRFQHMREFSTLVLYRRVVETT